VFFYSTQRDFRVAKRPSPSRPERPFHSIEEKKQDIVRLQRRIQDLEKFDPAAITKRDDPSVTEIQRAIDDTLRFVFGHGTIEYKKYESAGQLNHGLRLLSREWGRAATLDDPAEARRFVAAAEGKDQALVLLRQAVNTLEEEIEFTAPSPSNEQENPRQPSRKVFIVHGHDGEAKNEVARFLSKIELEEIILHERPNGGRHLLTKFQEES
jgi:hypothetical protein